MTKEEQRDLLVLEMKRCIELLENSNLSKIKSRRIKNLGLWSHPNRETTELNIKLREIRRDSVRLMKSIYAEGKR